MLSKEGDQVPIMPLFDVVSSSLKASPEQIAGICVNVGTVSEFTSIVIFTVSAHWPASGVKVYVVVVELSKEGDQRLRKFQLFVTETL